MKNKILINLQGQGDSGKTTILRHLFNLILNDTQMVHFETQSGRTGNIASQFIPTPLRAHNNNTLDEERTIFTMITKSGNGLKIGIATGGDNVDTVKASIKFFANHNCDIMITPTKSRGQTVDYILNEIQNDPNWVFLPFVSNRIEDEGSYHQMKVRLAEEIYAVLKSRWNTISITPSNIKFV